MKRLMLFELYHEVMESDNPEKLLDGILEDNISGSTDLAYKTIEFYSSSKGCSIEFMESSHARISEAHVGLGLVRNCNRMLFQSWVEKRGEIGKECDSLRHEVQGQTRLSIIKSVDIIEDGVSVATLSNSSAVRDALIANRKKLDKVYVLESRPGLEGQEMASELEANGINSILLADAAIQQASNLCDIALCGSDAVLADWSLIHKIGTYPLFLTFQNKRKSTFSITISMKFEETFESGTYPPFVEHDPKELSGKGIRALNIYFDLTPAHLISGFISEKGITGPTGPAKF